MRSNIELFIQQYRCCRGGAPTNRIQTPVRREVHVRNLPDLFTYMLNALDLLISGHLGPHKLQLNATSVLHYDVFGPD